MSQITEQSFITLHYRIAFKDAAGQEQTFLDTFLDKPATLLLGQGQLSPNLENALLGLAQGEKRVFELTPAQGYGDHNAELVQSVSTNLLRKEAELGTQFEVGDLVQFAAPQGGYYAGYVQSLDAEKAVIDFNHPLAGKAVIFEVDIIGVL